MLQECKRSKTQSSLQLWIVGDFGGCYWAFAAVLHWEGNMRTIWGLRRTFVRNLCEHPHSTFHLPKLSSTFGAIKGNPGFKSRNQIFLFLLPQWFLQLNQFAKKTRGASGQGRPNCCIYNHPGFTFVWLFSPLCKEDPGENQQSHLQPSFSALGQDSIFTALRSPPSGTGTTAVSDHLAPEPQCLLRGLGGHTTVPEHRAHNGEIVRLWPGGDSFHFWGWLSTDFDVKLAFINPQFWFSRGRAGHYNSKSIFFGYHDEEYNF